MGIRHLNSYMINNCSQGIMKVSFCVLGGCCLAIDASIYMYQYEMQNKLIENMTKLVNLFIVNNITPIFVFDGKPPDEKLHTLNVRRKRRIEAFVQCGEILEKIQSGDADEDDMNKYESLRKESTRITRDKIESVKNMLTRSGVRYYVACGEADELCASMVLNGSCWGCVSDDMDMFVYGCNNIIRNVDIHNKSAMVYDLSLILYELNISYPNFKQVCVLAGTDYNSKMSVSEKSSGLGVSSSPNLYIVFKMYNRFMKTVKYDNMLFYEWLRHYIKYNVDYDALYKICDMFTINNSEYMSIAYELDSCNSVYSDKK